MAPAPPSRVLLCADAAPDADALRRSLEHGGLAVAGQSLDNGAPDDPVSYDVVVLDGRRRASEALLFCRRFRSRLGEGFVPIVFLTEDATPAARLASLEAGADTYLVSPFEPPELLAQVRAFLRIKERQDRLTEK